MKSGHGLLNLVQDHKYLLFGVIVSVDFGSVVVMSYLSMHLMVVGVASPDLGHATVTDYYLS